MTESDVAKSDLLQRQQTANDFLFCRAAAFAKEGNGIVDGHVKHIVDIPSAIGYVQDIALEPLTMAFLAGYGYVGHELHLYGDCALTLAFLASATLGVEGEISGSEPHLLGSLLVGKETTYLIVGLEIGCRIASCGASDRVLINKLNGVETVEIAANRLMLSGGIAWFAKMAQKRTIQDITHQCRFARAADSGHHGHYPERKFHIYVLQVVFRCSADLYAVGPPTPCLGNVDRQASIEITGGVTIVGCFSYFRGRALEYDVTAGGSGFRSYVDKIVGITHNILIVFNDNNRVANPLKLSKDGYQAHGVA